MSKVSDLITGLHAQPLKTDDPERPLTQWLGYLGIIAALYAESLWPELNRALVLAFGGYGTALRALADWLMGRTPDGYSTNATNANIAINCLDYPLKPSGTPPAESEFLEASPAFGQMLYGSALLAATAGRSRRPCKPRTTPPRRQPRSSSSAPPAIPGPRTPTPSSSPNCFQQGCSSPATATATPPTDKATTASTTPSTRSSLMAPSRRTKPPARMSPPMSGESTLINDDPKSGRS